MPLRVIDEIIHLDNNSELNYTGEKVVIKPGAGIVCNSGSIELRLGDQLTLEHGSFIKVNGTSGKNGGHLTIYVDGPFLNFGEVSAESGSSIELPEGPLQGGIIDINCDRLINGTDGSITVNGITAGSSGGEININATALTNWGRITANAQGDEGTETKPLAGVINIEVTQYNVINSGTISSACAAGKAGSGGSIVVNSVGSISNSGLIGAGTFGVYDTQLGAPNAGEIILTTLYSVNNTGIIDASNWYGDNGKGGEINVLSIETIDNKGVIAADTYGSVVGGDHPQGGDVYLSTEDSLNLNGEISVDSKAWQQPEGNGTVILDYGQSGH